MGRFGGGRGGRGGRGRGGGGRGGARPAGRRKRANKARSEREEAAADGIVHNTKVRRRPPPRAAGDAAAADADAKRPRWDSVAAGVSPSAAASGDGGGTQSAYERLLSALPRSDVYARDDDDDDGERDDGSSVTGDASSGSEGGSDAGGDDDEGAVSGDDAGSNADDDAADEEERGARTAGDSGEDRSSDSGGSDDGGADAAASAAPQPSGAADDDPYVVRFARETLDEAAAAAAVRATVPYVAAPFSHGVAAAAVGAGSLDAATTVALSASPACQLEQLAAWFPRQAAPGAAAAGGGSASQRAAAQLSPPVVGDLARDLRVVPRLAAAWTATYGREAEAVAAGGSAADGATPQPAGSTPTAAARPQQHPLTPLQALLWPALSTYRDVYFAARSADNARELRCVAALHALNHVFKARELTARHDAQLEAAAVAARVARDERRLRKGKRAAGLLDAADQVPLASAPRGPATAPAAAAGAKRAGADGGAVTATQPSVPPLLRDEGGADGGGAAGDDVRDQGFTRARVLVLLPFRAHALAFVRTLLRLLPGYSVMNRNRFFKEYSEEDSGLGADWDDDEAELRDAARGKPSATRAALAALSRRAREMMSDADDDSEAGSDGNESDAAGGDGAARRRRRYAFAGVRQGVPASLVRAAQRDRGAQAAAASAADANDGAPARAQRPPNPRPRDYRRMVAGNIDDDFRLGVGLRRRDVKLYADFYDADIIVASPLALRRHIGGEGDRGRRETDFLSSVEVVLLDGVEVLLQQNWEHVRDVFAALNRQPAASRGTDFTRVREWNLSGLARHFRQTVAFSAYVDVDLSALMRRACANTAGGALLRCEYGGTLARVLPPLRHVFLRVPAADIAAADDARLDFFTAKLLPELLAGCAADGSRAAAHTLLVAPSYFDYVRLRNLLDAREAEFATLSEYSEDADVSRARGRFFAGDSPLLLMTERFHFWRRYRLRGVRHVLFYGPPANCHFYPELLNCCGEAAAAGHAVSTTTLFTRFDAPALERVVGSERAPRLLADSPKSTFVFV